MSVTISMSALFQRESGNFLQTTNAGRALELRTVPYLYEITTSNSPDWGDQGAAQVLENLYSNMNTNWMYSATIQLSLNGSQPPWSQDGWSFVPIDVSSITNASTIQNAGNAPDEPGQSASTLNPANISVQTPAIRGRVECSPYDGLNNLSNWITTYDLTNSSVWNVSVNPKDLKTGYELGARNQFGNTGATTALSMIYLTDSVWNGYESYASLNTSIFANPSQITCCGNSSSSKDSAGAAAVGYWSSNDPNNFPFSGAYSWPVNFTSKWIYGSMRSDYYRVNDSFTNHLIFTEVPGIQAINCKPIIEIAEANVTVDQTTRQVQSFEILEEPTLSANAWTDVFAGHNRSSDLPALNETESLSDSTSNVTTR